jgi:hypothetical protein
MFQIESKVRILKFVFMPHLTIIQETIFLKTNLWKHANVWFLLFLDRQKCPNM